MQKKESPNTGKRLFGGFSIFYSSYFILYKISFREVNIQKNLWKEIKVTYEVLR